MDSTKTRPLSKETVVFIVPPRGDAIDVEVVTNSDPLRAGLFVRGLLWENGRPLPGYIITLKDAS